LDQTVSGSYAVDAQPRLIRIGLLDNGHQRTHITWHVGSPIAVRYDANCSSRLLTYLLLDGVEHTCRLTHLSLRYNQIGDEGAAHLGRCLGNATSQNTQLQTLNLAGNRITDVGARHIANVSLV